MENRKSRIYQSFPKVSNDVGEELLLRCGEIVPRSGIYEAIHSSETEPQDGTTVVALKGEQVQPCMSCGDGLQLRLVYAAPHISEDGDFCSSGHKLN